MRLRSSRSVSLRPTEFAQHGHHGCGMQREFLKLAEETGGGLPLTQFVEAFGAVIGSELSKERLVHLFMKIDANSDGSVDWDEFSTYLLLGALLSASAAALRYLVVVVGRTSEAELNAA